MHDYTLTVVTIILDTIHPLSLRRTAKMATINKNIMFQIKFLVFHAS